MNRFASTGETAEPCGVPRSRACKDPPGICMSAASHRFTYSTTQRASVCFSTALTTRSHRTLSKETTTYYWYRGLSVVGDRYARSTSVAGPVSYTHLTLP